VTALAAVEAVGVPWVVEQTVEALPAAGAVTRTHQRWERGRQTAFGIHPLEEVHEVGARPSPCPSWVEVPHHREERGD